MGMIGNQLAAGTALTIANDNVTDDGNSLLNALIFGG